MIVRQRGNHFVLTNQHQHGLMCGVFAEHIEQAIRPRDETIYAISHHDLGWIELDRKILWNEKTNQPYSFMEYPLKPRLEAYMDGISKMESRSIYAGYLGSKHYVYFLDKETDPMVAEFIDKEQIRRQRMRKYLNLEEKQYLLDNFRLLRFCDDLSLALCLNEPGSQTHEWYKNGIQYNGQVYQWVWEDIDRLRLSPNIFADSFPIEISYQVVDQQRNIVQNGEYKWQILI